MVGLIDGVIAQSRIVARYLERHPAPDPAVREALADLRSDEDIAAIVVSRWQDWLVAVAGIVLMGWGLWAFVETLEYR